MTTQCLHETFEERAAAAPGALAVVSEDVELTYGELDARADRMAQVLVDAGVRRGSLVGIHLERGAQMVVAILATLKAGAGYAMLDPEFPVHRLRDMVEDVAPAVVIADSEADVDRLGTPAAFVRMAAGDADRPLPRGAAGAGAEDVACVIFTSGSTGRPKGVAAPHRTVVGTVLGQSYTRFGPDTVWLQCAPVSWDAFALELWGPLLTGGTCVFHPGRPNPLVMERLVADHGITTMNLPTVLFHVIMDEYPEALEGLSDLLVGGEALSPEHAARVVRDFPDLRFVNGYGPVECMVFVTTHLVTAQSAARTAVPIGRSLVGKEVYVLDEELRPVADGEVGELYAAGAGVAHGYLRRPALTAERFVADPFAAPGGRMYRTGDFVRWHEDGPLEFIGRVDGLVKVRGIRIDLGEVESVLETHPAVKRAVVVATGERPENRRLVAYLTLRPEQGAETAKSALRAHAAEKMPDFMVPYRFVVLDAFPVTHNGKIDRKALPALGAESSLGGMKKC
ncbi:amino acid adenylation domain-containing protein [Streptomyces sp. NRRL S-87]|uniref:amino acid adenylation domain-containing protein n=1 Tax=Streptomyces sp. NRRL S-87 TaxID=1463920 RepID=UPI00068B030D|nr:amino acid adenylation domain-containing protein [Streptomyces sp. NRRL S-87]